MFKILPTTFAAAAFILSSGSVIAGEPGPHESHERNANLEASKFFDKAERKEHAKRQNLLGGCNPKLCVR